MKDIQDLLSAESTKQDRYSLRKIGGNSRIQGLIKSLFISSIVFYAKCFTKAEGRKIKLESTIIPHSLSDKHQTIMNFRHTIAAHSGLGEWDTGTVDVIHPPVDFIKNNVGIHIMPVLKRFNLLDDRGDGDSFISLIDAVKEKANIKIHLLGDKIIRDLIVPKGQAYWYEND